MCTWVRLIHTERISHVSPVPTSNPRLMSVPSRPEPISHQHQSSPCDLQTDSTGALTYSVAATRTPLLLISVSSACQRQCYYILN